MAMVSELAMHQANALNLQQQVKQPHHQWIACYYVTIIGIFSPPFN